jgi:hypothetical protein
MVVAQMDLSGPSIDVKLKERKKERKWLILGTVAVQDYRTSLGGFFFLRIVFFCSQNGHHL